MKKLFTLLLLTSVFLSLVACGSATITMVDITSNAGITAKLPSNLSTTDQKMYIDNNTGENAVFSSEDAASDPIDAYTQANLLAAFQKDHPDAAITSFDNSKQIDGMKSIQATGTLTSDKGTAVTFTMVVFTDGTKNYIINYTCIKDGSLAQNIQESIDSLKIQ